MAEYFSHDYDTRSDEKIIDLMAEVGWTGYGLFWGIVELLYQNEGTMQTQYKRIAYALGSDQETVRSIIEDFDLFVVKGDVFWSDSVNNRLDERAEKSEKARQSAYKRWNKQKVDADVMQTHSDGNAKKERKGKERKEKNKDIHLSDLKKSDMLTEIEEITISFWELFKHNLEKLGITSTDLGKAKYKVWVNPVRLMIQADSRKIEELREIWGYLNTEDLTADFTWSSNIRSTAKLREKFERLLTEARKQSKKSGGYTQELINKLSDDG